MSKERFIYIGIILGILIIAGIYFIYNNDNEQDSEEIEIDNSEDYFNMREISNINVLHWNHMPLTYDIYDCPAEKIKRAVEAMAYLEDKVENIQFIEYEWNVGEEYEPDIFWTCEDIQMEGGFVVAEAYYDITDKNEIVNGTIWLYNSHHCVNQRPVNEIHELLHLFGLGHTPTSSEYWKDIMYPYALGCDADISEKDIAYRKSVYG